MHVARRGHSTFSERAALIVLLGSVEQQRYLDRRKMLRKFLLISASVLALASSALATLPAVAADNDFLVLTQPNGRKVVIAPFSIVAIWSPPQGVCKGETQIVTSSINFCVIEKVEDVIAKLKNFPCVENPHTSAQTLRRCK